MIEQRLDAQTVSDQIQIETATIVPAKGEHAVNDLRSLFHAIPFQQMKKGFRIGGGPEGLTDQQCAAELLVIIDLAVEQQYMFLIQERLMSVGGQVKQAQPIVDEPDMLIPEVTSVVWATMDDGLCKALQELVIYMLRIGNACKTTHGIRIFF